MHDLIPFEKQEVRPDDQMCGAAALCMVYRSLGLTCTQTKLWPAISRPGCRGRVARTQLLCRHALGLGLDALIVQADDPRRALRRCLDGGLRVILNHRLARDVPAGHYSVLLASDDAGVCLHDPFFGPNLRRGWPELSALWRPGGAEVIGRIFVALAVPPSGAPPCPACQTPLPETVSCPWCRQIVPLRPGAALGCLRPNCTQRSWRQVFCPHCDGAMVPSPGRAADE